MRRARRASPLPPDRAQADRDEEVLRLFRVASPTAAPRLAEVFAQRMHGLARRILDTEEDAQEAVQEALLTVCRKWATFQGRARFSSWVYRITANEAYMQLRRERNRQRETALGETAADGVGGRDAALVRVPRTPEEESEIHEVGVLVLEEVERLPEALRVPYFLYEVQGLSVREVSEATGLGPAAVKSKVHRARVSVREHLRPRLSLPASAGPPRGARPA